MRVKAVIWDYDGTLTDSTNKNREVTIAVLQYFNPAISECLPPALTSAENYKQANFKYKNWKELYQFEFKLSEDDVEKAGKLWSPCQLANSTVADLYPGLKALISSLGKIPQGICSQNCAINIQKTLEAYDLAEYFQGIVGYEEVAYKEQKPHPTGFIKCLDTLAIPLSKKEPAAFIYIGDHLEDVVFARNTERILQDNGYPITIISIAVSYSGSCPEKWEIKPDFIASSAGDIEKIIKCSMFY